MSQTVELNKYIEQIKAKRFVKYTGYITEVVGMTIESQGPMASVGELCLIYTKLEDEPVLAEVVGFKGENILLMALGEMKGIASGSLVVATGRTLRVKVGHGLKGRVVDALGNPMDDLGPIKATDSYPVDNNPPNPLSRTVIRESMPVGIRAIDGMLTLGRGQRIGIFAGSGVGKSTLLGMLARNSEADINVIGLIGERGREVREFIEHDLGEEGLKRSVVVVVTGDQPALLRKKGAMVATSIAEYFRDNGLNVLLMMDSLTRFSLAQREIGLATGEPPVTRGYTPSVFATLPRLLERTGTSKEGSITALYTVLVDGDDMNEPISDTVRGILDGHIVLSRRLANMNHYPAIDVLASVSRVMPNVADDEHKKSASIIKDMMATYRESEDIINIGAYKEGSNPKIDTAIKVRDSINDFLIQGTYETAEFDTTLQALRQIESETE